MKRQKWIISLLAAGLICSTGLVHLTEAQNKPIETNMQLQKPGGADTNANGQRSLLGEETTPAQEGEIKGEVAKFIIDVKKRFDITDAYTNFEYTKSQEGSLKIYNFVWSNDDSSINVSFGDDGNVYAYSKSDQQYIPYVMQNSRKQIYVVDKKKAIERGQEFLKKVFPTLFKNYQYDENPYDSSYGTYNLNFTYWVDAVATTFQTATVSVDPMTAEIRSFYATYPPEAGYPQKGNAISQDKAKAAYRKDLGLKLIYQVDVDYSGAEPVKSAAKIVYVPRYGDHTAIDAISGEKTTLDPVYHYGRQKTLAMGSSEQADGLTPEEKKQVDVMEGYLSAGQALDKVKASPIPGLPKDLKMSSSYMTKRTLDVEGNYVWSLTLTSISDGQYQLYATVNAKTGEILDFFTYNDGPSTPKDKKSATRADVKAASQELLKKMLPQRSSNFVLDEDSLEEAFQRIDPYQNDINISFVREVNGLQVPSNTVSMTYSSSKKQITSYSLTWYAMEFPKPDKVLEGDALYDKLFQQFPLTLYYTNQRDENNDHIRLIYSLKKTNNPIVLNATTGELILGQKEEKSLSPYLDIEASPHKKIYEALSEINIGFDTEKLEEEKAISRKEFLTLLLQTYNDSNVVREITDEELYDQLTKRGILERGAILTKGNISIEEALGYAVDSLGYSKLAAQNAAFSDNYSKLTGVSSTVKGSVVMAQMLGILNDMKDGTQATRALTRGEALVILYHYLKS